MTRIQRKIHILTHIYEFVAIRRQSVCTKVFFKTNSSASTISNMSMERPLHDCRQRTVTHRAHKSKSLMKIICARTLRLVPPAITKTSQQLLHTIVCHCVVNRTQSQEWQSHVINVSILFELNYTPLDKYQNVHMSTTNWLMETRTDNCPRCLVHNIHACDNTLTDSIQTVLFDICPASCCVCERMNARHGRHIFVRCHHHHHHHSAENQIIWSGEHCSISACNKHYSQRRVAWGLAVCKRSACACSLDFCK